MVRAPFFDKNGLKKGAWSQEEDDKLKAYVQRYGHWNWRQLPKFAGLSRCGKSCRLRWMNYLRPGVRHGNYTKQEEDLIIKLHEQIGKKWSIIASKLPGRTDNEVKNYWHTYLKKRAKHYQLKSGLEDLSTATSSSSEINDRVREVVEDKTVVANHPSQLILESSLLSPESSSSKISSITSDSSDLFTTSDINWTAEDSFTSFESFEISCGDFWTEPFIADNAYNLDAQFMSPYDCYSDDSIDLLYQVMQELP